MPAYHHPHYHRHYIPTPARPSPLFLSQVEFTIEHDLTSPAKSPLFEDGLRAFRGSEDGPNVAVIVVLMGIDTSSKKPPPRGGPKITPMGWTALPVFRPASDPGTMSEFYVQNGQYQLPLVKGAPTPELIQEMAFEQPLKIIQRELGKGKKGMQYIDGASVFVRLVDDQLIDGVPPNFGPLNTSYLPDAKGGKYERDMIKVGKDKATLQKKVLPKGAVEKEWAKEMNVAFATLTEIDHYQFH